MPDKPRLNSPPQGYAEPHHAMASYYAYHNDQGMLADMSIADIHFIPHSDRLSATGQARLERYAELLADTGGTLRFDTKVNDDDLVRARLIAANSFLAELECTHPILVAVGGAGGRGMTAQEASGAKAVAKQPEARKEAYHLNKKEGSSSSGNP
ncbi:MAG TPA: hypothetical protein VMV81_04910 [Phycisphaerae bacterium]|nr:hypothetical protein [Phycisphaerae bacterium]